MARLMLNAMHVALNKDCLMGTWMARWINTGFLSTAAVLGALLCPPAYADTIIDYTFSNDTSFSIPNYAAPFVVSGTFDYDVENPADTTVDFEITGGLGGGQSILLPYTGQPAILSPL